MNYFSLSDHELHVKTLCASAGEKMATFTLLEYLAEVDRRRLYAERGFSSLWMYVHKELGYSEAQASERVGAMRLMINIPEVKQGLITNQLTLTSAAKLAIFVKREKPSAEKTLELLNQVSEKSSREVERLLFSEQKIPDTRPDLVKTTGAHHSRISFDADEEFMTMLTRVKALQANPTLSLQDLFKKIMKEYIVKKELKEQKTLTGISSYGTTKNVSKISPASIRTQHAASRAPEVKKRRALRPPEKKVNELAHSNNENIAHTRYIPIAVKKFVRLRSNDQCEYLAKITDEKNGELIHRRCESQSQLQFDHIKPYSLGGSSGAENIRHLCRAHNFHAASKIFGMKKMNLYSSEENHPLRAG